MRAGFEEKLYLLKRSEDYHSLNWYTFDTIILLIQLLRNGLF